MNYAKIKRAVSALTAAALCFALSLSVPAAAKTDAAMWREVRTIAGVKYNSSYIKWLEKYSAKEAKSTVAYSKSRTKKFVYKFSKAAYSDEPRLSLSIINDERAASAAVKGDKFRVIGCIDDYCLAYYSDSENITFFDFNAKEKFEGSMNNASEYGLGFSNASELAEECGNGLFDFFIPDDEKGKVFKIKSGEKIYYYEEFYSDMYGVLGFLFSEDGNILALKNQDGSFCVSFSQKVDDSVFNMPEKGFKKVKLEDFAGL